ncbi:hypothetical protein QTA56_02755 [Acinetobacter sp. VNH17]|uniref:Transposase n=1 Tax=Acinetobacter thutiue TaxID=2998078 RepID=A0ABT7WKQ7_9GAMM|nr:hypothetical protein [Acinetobacter thutiue]MCY6411057.1 hypothetical protein [Acinetobacter thutiue]MDN0013159.1 hypothetical protein [Acinetobacter thutiue]
MTDVYACASFEMINNLQTCVQYIQIHQSWLDELNNLTRAQANGIITEAITFWLLCWGYRELLQFIRR